MNFEALFKSKVFYSNFMSLLAEFVFGVILALALLKAGVSDPGATWNVVGGSQWFRYD